MNDNNVKIVFRTAGRLLAIQGLYQMDLARHNVSEVMNNLRMLIEAGEIEHINMKHCDFAHTEGLLRGIIAEQKKIDTLIQSNLPEKWTIKKLDKVILATLRAGLYEILYVTDVPKQVVLNEYTNLAASFGVSDNNNLVSGLLNKIAHEKP